jgi:hypothetical protein
MPYFDHSVAKDLGAATSASPMTVGARTCGVIDMFGRTPFYLLVHVPRNAARACAWQYEVLATRRRNTPGLRF